MSGGKVLARLDDACSHGGLGRAPAGAGVERLLAPHAAVEPQDMIGFLLIFIVYQIYRMILGPSAGLAALTAFDIFVVWLTYREYGKQRSRRAAPRAFRVLR